MKKILIVEDVEFNLDLLIQLLEDDYKLVWAMDGQAGVDLAEQERPDLILMDMSLPVMDGWTATGAIKARPGLAHIPIVGLSSHAMQGDAAKAFASGCDDYLTKPLDEDLLFATISRYLGQD
jgi:CheY-like chemotaxis protein